MRELINVLEFSLASAGADPTIHPKHLPPDYRAAMLDLDSADPIQEVLAPQDTGVTNSSEFPTLARYRSLLESKYLKHLIKKTHGNKDEACRLSGISLSHLYG